MPRRSKAATIAAQMDLSRGHDREGRRHGAGLRAKFPIDGKVARGMTFYCREARVKSGQPDGWQSRNEDGDLADG